MIKRDELTKIYNLLKSTSDGNIRELELTHLITMSKNLISPYIFQTKKDFLFFASKIGFTVEDVCYDVLSKVFRKDNFGNFPTLISLFENLNKDSKNDEELNVFLAYQSLLRKITDITINELYAEIDPLGFKILRNIKYNLPNSKLNIRDSILGKLIYYVNIDNDHLPYIDIDAFQTFFFDNIELNRDTHYLLDRLADSLLCFEEYRKEIRLNDVVQIFKKYFNVFEKIENDNEDDENIFSPTYFSTFQLDSPILKQKLREITVQKLFIYYQKTLINKAQLQGLYYAVLDIIDDITSGIGLQCSLYNYINEHYKLSQTLYNSIFRNKIEYILKLIKEEILNYFK